MIKRHHHIGFALNIPGMILQFAGTYMLRDEGLEEAQALTALVMVVVGTLLSVMGLAFYAKAKGHSAAYGLLGVMGIFGLIVLGSLKDESGDPWNTGNS